jgi:AraC-like DNA-binding protein
MSLTEGNSTHGGMQVSLERGLESWSTQAADGNPFRYWQDLICQQLLELQIETPQPSRFEASMLRRRLGAVSCNLISAQQQTAVRTHEAIRRTREPRFDLVHVREGNIALDHCGRRLDVYAGQCTLIDSSRTYSFATSETSSSLSVQIPQKWLRALISTPEEGVARVITHDTPWGNALLATLSALTPQSLASLAIPGEVVAEQIAGLLALAISKPDQAMTAAQQKLLPLLRETLNAMAYDESTSPQSVAAAHGISKRYLHTLFSAAGTTFSRELLEARLQRAERLLRDAQFSRLTVLEIAWRCGFADSSHFARRFKLKFGKSPREYRCGLTAGS